MRGPRHAIGIATAMMTMLAASGAPATARDLPPSAATPAEQIAGFIASAARRFAVPDGWIYAVIRAESAGDPHAVSRAGAMGLMQIMPATWSYLRARYGLGADPFDARDNVTAGAAWLRELHDRYGSPGFLAAYNAGPARYDDHLATGRPLPAETRAYVASLAPRLGNPVALKRIIDPLAWTRAALFPAHSEGPSVDADSTVAPPNSDAPNGLFLPLTGQAPRP